MTTNKVRMTRPKVYDLNGRDKVINVKNLDCLLGYFLPIGYNYNVEGWTYDVYDLLGYTFVTGRRPIGNSIDYELVNKYNNLAREISSLYIWEEKQARALELLAEFIRELER